MKQANRRGKFTADGENGLQQLLAPDGFLRLFSEIAMSAKINGVSLPEISYTTPVDPPRSQLLQHACDRWLRSRGLPVRRKFGQPDGKRKGPALTLIPKSKQMPGRRAEPD